LFPRGTRRPSSPRESQRAHGLLKDKGNNNRRKKRVAIQPEDTRENEKRCVLSLEKKNLR